MKSIHELYQEVQDDYIKLRIQLFESELDRLRLEKEITAYQFNEIELQRKIAKYELELQRKGI